MEEVSSVGKTNIKRSGEGTQDESQVLPARAVLRSEVLNDEYSADQ
jgi:hypothetical protein